MYKLTFVCVYITVFREIKLHSKRTLISSMSSGLQWTRPCRRWELLRRAVNITSVTLCLFTTW